MRFVRPKLITFDVTGTLLMTKVEKYYAEAGLDHGLMVDSTKLAGSFKNHFKRMAKEHPVFGKHTGLGSENWWRSVVYGVFRDQNAGIPEEKLSKVADTLIECYRTKMCWHTFPGTIELLNYLQKQGILLGIISNFDDGLDPILYSLNIRQYFFFVLCSYQLGIEKPDPLIFKEALSIFKKSTRTNILPVEALHIGDRVDNDYMGAKNAEWNALLIKRDDGLVDPLISKADIFKSLEELKNYFKSQLNEPKASL